MSDIVNNPPKAIAIAFGYEHKMLPESKKYNIIKENATQHKCMMCGRVQKRGYLMKKDLDLIGIKQTNMYSFSNKQSLFLCEYCNFCNASYEAAKNKLKMPMTDCIIFEKNGKIEVDFKNNLVGTDDGNGIYELITNTPEPPFIFLFRKAKGNRFYEHWYKAVPTVDKKLIVINFGYDKLVVSPKHVLNLLADFQIFSDKHKKTKIPDGVVFNNVAHAKLNQNFSHNMRSDEEAHRDYSELLSKYSSPAVRIVAKTMLNEYKLKNKDKKC